MARARIGELLVEAKVITQAQLDEALAAQSTRNGEQKKLGQALVELGYVTETQLTQMLSLQLSVPWVSLYHVDFSRQLLNMVPRDLAERFCSIPIFVRSVKKQATLYVAMDDPTNEQALAAIERSAGLPCKPMIASPSDIRSAIRVYYATESQVAEMEKAQTAKAEKEKAEKAAAEKPAPPPPPPAKPPAPPAKPPPPPPTGRAPLPTMVDTLERFALEPAGDDAPTFPRAPMDSEDSPDAYPDIEVSEYVPKRRSSHAPRMVALTLLDGTTLNLPAKGPMDGGAAPNKREGSIPDQLTARDLVSALRAISHGADASEILGPADWQALFAALLSLMLKKNLIADWEFVEELRNV